jgi:glyoxylase-like metal-dependent hydrolase (beta-lactamase superfamily II)
MFHNYHSNYNATTPFPASQPKKHEQLRNVPLFDYPKAAMPKANELIRVSPNYAIWQAYDRSVKTDLFSTAAVTQNGLIVIDPILLTTQARIELEETGKIYAVLLSNANHARAMTEFADTKSCWVPDQLRATFAKAQVLADGTSIHGLEVIAIDGASPGEFAFYDVRDGGTLIVGDALINFEPHGFTFLPSKYCTNRKQMIGSLRQLLELRFNRMFFAHGYPLLTDARDRLATLLDECS